MQSHYKLLIISMFYAIFIIHIRPFFLTFFFFPNIIMYTLNIANVIKKMTVNEIRVFILENVIDKLDFLKKTVFIQ